MIYDLQNYKNIIKTFYKRKKTLNQKKAERSIIKTMLYCKKNILVFNEDLVAGSNTLQH